MTVRLESKCDACGEVAVYECLVTGHRCVDIGTVDLTITISDAEWDKVSMRLVGDKMFCHKHDIQIRRELIIDGVTIDGLQRPWGHP